MFTAGQLSPVKVSEIKYNELFIRQGMLLKCLQDASIHKTAPILGEIQEGWLKGEYLHLSDDNEIVIKVN